MHSREDLSRVGLVVWQSAFVLAELLLRHPPFGQWHDVRVVDLGTGTGAASSSQLCPDLISTSLEGMASSCPAPDAKVMPC